MSEFIKVHGILENDEDEALQFFILNIDHIVRIQIVRRKVYEQYTLCYELQLSNQEIWLLDAENIQFISDKIGIPFNKNFFYKSFQSLHDEYYSFDSLEFPDDDTEQE